MPRACSQSQQRPLLRGVADTAASRQRKRVRYRKRVECSREEGSAVPAAEGSTCSRVEGGPLPDPSGCRGGPRVAGKAAGTMQLGLVALAMVFLSSMGHSDVLKLSKARRQRRISTEGPPPSCPKGCDRCSEYNGCVKCKPKLFIFLERNDIRQIGVCLASCPMGYFGMRNPETNRCTQCKIENCEACFNRNFCTKCKEGLYSHRGRCHVTCPPGLSTINGTMECLGFIPGQPVVECELGEWSQWSPCMKKNKTCGFKKGSQSRVRVPLQLVPSLDTPPVLVTSQPCAPQTEKKKCTVLKIPCARGRKNKGGRKDEPNRREKESGRGRGQEGKEGSRGGGGGKRRKGQSRTTTAPGITTSSIT